MKNIERLKIASKKGLVSKGLGKGKRRAPEGGRTQLASGRIVLKKKG